MSVAAAAVASGREVRSLWARDCRGGGLCRAWCARAREQARALPARLTPGGGGGGCCSGTFQNVLMPPSVPPSLVSRAGLPVRFTQRIGSFIDSEIATVILTHWGEEQSRGRKESAAEWRCRVGQ